MSKNVLIFFICFAVAFAGGYALFQTGQPADVASDPAATAPADAQKKEEPAQTTAPSGTASAGGEIFTQRGCSACHAVSALNVQGGATGPDLSQAYVNVKDKHGVPIEEFLKKPTSAVMSSVLGSQPLTDEEREAILTALKLASEKK